jgi:cytoskeleton protein RodZ
VSSQPDQSAGSDGIGARLRAGRERAGLSLIEAAERLHVDPRAVEALEAERFEEFAAPVYVRGHIRHYAELVGESPLELQELYSANAHAVPAPDLTRVPSARRAEASPSALLPGLVVVAVVALVGSGWWIAGNPGGSQSGSPSSAGFSSAPQPALAAGAEPNGAVAGSSVAPRPAAAAHPVATLRPTAAPAVVAHAPAGAAAELGTAAVTATGPPPPVRVLPAAHPRRSELQLHFSEDSWAEVYDAQGERLLFDVGAADSTRSVSGAPPLRIVLGNPVGVALELDGRPVSMPDGAARNVSIEFRINRSGHIAPPRLAAAEARNEERKPGRD